MMAILIFVKACYISKIHLWRIINLMFVKEMLYAKLASVVESYLSSEQSPPVLLVSGISTQVCITG